MYLMSRWTSSDFVCSEDMLNLIMNWSSWPRIKTLLDVFLFSKDFYAYPVFFVHFLTTSHGEGSFYPSLRWSKDGIWSIGHCVWPGFSDFLSALKEWGQVHRKKTWCLCVQVRFISFFQGLNFSGEACYRIHYHAAPASNFIDLNKVNMNMLSSTEESFRSDWKPPIHFSESQDGSWKSANWISTGQSSCKPPFFGFHGNFAGVYLLSVALSFKMVDCTMETDPWTETQNWWLAA